MIALESSLMQKRVLSERRGVGLFNLNLQQVRELVVPLPPLSEQHRIVADVERRLSIADEIGTTLDSALARAARLRQSILKRAFEGKLVPQDPNDEQASALLERIRAERVSREVATPRRGRRAAEASASSLPRRRARGVRD
jgi:type I restriction enzyme S subunit